MTKLSRFEEKILKTIDDIKTAHTKRFGRGVCHISSSEIEDHWYWDPDHFRNKEGGSTVTQLFRDAAGAASLIASTLTVPVNAIRLRLGLKNLEEQGYVRLSGGGVMDEESIKKPQNISLTDKGYAYLRDNLRPQPEAPAQTQGLG